MAGVNTPRESYKGELVTPIRENADIPHNDGPEHQHKKIQDGIPSNPAPDEKDEVVSESEETESDSDSE